MGKNRRGAIIIPDAKKKKGRSLGPLRVTHPPRTCPVDKLRRQGQAVGGGCLGEEKHKTQNTRSGGGGVHTGETPGGAGARGRGGGGGKKKGDSYFVVKIR